MSDLKLFRIKTGDVEELPSQSVALGDVPFLVEIG